MSHLILLSVHLSQSLCGVSPECVWRWNGPASSWETGPGELLVSSHSMAYEPSSPMGQGWKACTFTGACSYRRPHQKGRPPVELVRQPAKHFLCSLFFWEPSVLLPSGGPFNSLPETHLHPDVANILTGKEVLLRSWRMRASGCYKEGSLY